MSRVVEEEEGDTEDTETVVEIPPGSSSPGCEDDDECFSPFTVRVGTGETIIWKNEDRMSHMMISGPHPDADQKHDEHRNEEEIDLGFLEVGPR